MNFIDAHSHVWTDDTAHYPSVRAGRRGHEARPLHPEDLFKHTKGPPAVNRVISSR